MNLDTNTPIIKYVIAKTARKYKNKLNSYLNSLQNSLLIENYRYRLKRKSPLDLSHQFP